MTPAEKAIVPNAQEANHNADHTCWWMKGVDRDEAQRLGLTDRILTVLSLLQKSDNITMDIQITIKQKQ